jgi:glucokinase
MNFIYGESNGGIGKRPLKIMIYIGRKPKNFLNKNFMPSKKEYAIGIDIGGTKMAAALFDGGKVVGDFDLATPKESLDHFLVMLKALVDPLLNLAKTEKARVSGIGIGIPGNIDSKTGKIFGLPNLPILEGRTVGEMIKKMFDMPVYIDNDAKVFVRGEAVMGAGKTYKSVYGFTIGTGIGGSWWNNGEIHRGFFGGAGEPGHMVIDFSSGMDFEKCYQKILKNDPARLSQEAVLGDVLAQKLYEEFGRHLGVLLSNIVNLLDPEVFIIGGSVVDSADLFLSVAKKTMKEFVDFTPSANKVKILKSKLGHNAGIIGAALLVPQNE